MNVKKLNPLTGSLLITLCFVNGYANACEYISSDDQAQSTSQHRQIVSIDATIIDQIDCIAKLMESVEVRNL